MAANDAAVQSAVVPNEYLQPEGLRTLAMYLKSANGVKTKQAVQYGLKHGDEKRVECFKGAISPFGLSGPDTRLNAQ